MGEPPKGEIIKKAKKAILKLFKDGLKVAYDRELRYRLERQFPHDAVAFAISELNKNKKLKVTHIPGRRGAGKHPNKFCRLPGTPYKKLIPIMRKKLDLSVFISGVSNNMGRHAELVWWHAFKRNNWTVHPTQEKEFGGGINEYKGRRSSIANDIDFIAEKDDIEYGVEVKNGLGYPEEKPCCLPFTPQGQT